ncbi:MAG: RDD family protein [Candidatus Eremiobacteraeota bacterium]|nr:RDD family protein [Candidatus Eremiobacteraeota bacterium]
MERNVEVATGESVAFSYELAGLGSRFLAYFIDFAIQIAVVIGAVLFFSWLSSAFPQPAKAAGVSKFATAIVIGTLVFALFMLFFGYFIILEWLWGGRTLGKRLMGLRVVRDGGFPLDFTSSVVRNVVRMLEFGLGFYVVSAAATILSPFNRRLGDMAAGTIVVRDHRYERASYSVGRESGDDLVVAALAPEERALVRRYADRRDALGPTARTTVAASIARAVRPKLAANYAHLDDDALLTYLAEHALG